MCLQRYPKHYRLFTVHKIMCVCVCDGKANSQTSGTGSSYNLSNRIHYTVVLSSY